MSDEFGRMRLRAIEWARTAGGLARERLGRAVASRKADETVVTDADHAVQAMLLEYIGREFPGDAVIAEETQPLPQRHAPVASARRCWVIDPIDGTRNYARAFPLFSVVIALMEAGSPVVGVIHNPMTGEMYSASIGGGAWWDDRRLQVRDEPMSGGSLIAVPSARRGPLAGFVHRWVDRMVLRNVGSTALHLALVGSGAIDAAFVDDCRLWDVAAGALIAAEAGAVVVRPDGGRPFPLDLANYREQDVPMLAAGPKLAEQLLADISAASAS
jgi:myo-inositol-1(or 4)-monophosphatase